MNVTKTVVSLLFLFVVCLPSVQAAPAAVSPSDPAQSSEMIMQQFAGDVEVSPERRIETRTKHQILFLMGISLLVLLLLTGIMGIAMAAFGKDVFVPHMILAGLSMTLAIVHAATSIAWFWPY